MTELNLPAYPFKLEDRHSKISIFDEFRRSWVVLTPEEWVRQHFLMWLVNSLGYPKGLLAVEASLKYNKLKMRADGVVYDKNGLPLMIVECKAPHIDITQETFLQAARYNFSFNTQYLALTNGLEHYCCRIDKISGKLDFLEDFPPYEQLL